MTIAPPYLLLYIMQIHGSISVSYLRRKYKCTEKVALANLADLEESYPNIEFDSTGKRLKFVDD